MSEIRLFVRRDSLQNGAGCTWVMLGDDGFVQQSGAHLDELPNASLCRLVLSSDLVLMLPANLPDLPARKLTAMLPAAAETATLDDAEQLHVTLLGHTKTQAGQMAVVNKAWLEQWLTLLRQRNLYPDQAVPEFLLLPWTAGEWSVLVNEDGVVARFGEFNGAALDQGNPPAGLNLALQQGALPKRIRVFQGNALNAPDVAAWQTALNVPVELDRRWDWREAVWNEKASLLTHTFEPSRNRRDWGKLARQLGKGAALLAAVQLFGMSLDWIAQTQEQYAIRSEMQTLAAKALPAHASVVEPTWQVAERLRSLHSAAGGKQPDSVLTLIAQLGQSWPPGNGPVPLNLEYTNKALELNLASAEDNWLNLLKESTARHGLDLTIKNEAGKIRLRVKTATISAGGQK